jgi:hypothetical protein
MIDHVDHAHRAVASLLFDVAHRLAGLNKFLLFDTPLALEIVLKDLASDKTFSQFSVDSQGKIS